ncbi:MAG TPA: PaaI family thioesterase [Chondromyces sp.]|nr:PaaI family thioesterase [Chondromyces sp.]
MTDDHFRRLERMYLSAPFNEMWRPRISITEGAAEISFDVGPHLHHAARAAHGANYFKAMDDAAFFAVNSLVDDVFVLTSSFTLYFLRPISEGTMVARGTVLSSSRNLWVAEATLEDGNGRLLGRGSGTFMRSRMRLADAMGYGDDG